MTKKTLFLSSIPIMALPAFAVVSCAGTTQMQGQTELARSAFLAFKSALSQIAKASKPTNAAEFEQEIKKFSNPLITYSEIKVQTEGNNFAVNYKLLVWSGSFDQAINDKNEIKKNGTEELTGTLRFPILANS